MSTMDVTVFPGALSGTVSAPSSKSFSHRELIAAALSQGTSRISGVSFSRDIEVTCGCLEALGAKIQQSGTEFTVSGISQRGSRALLDCGESGSTLRFMMPVASALGAVCEFTGSGRLPERPYTTYVREMGAHGITFSCEQGLPVALSGTLESGDYYIEGDISSQFVTGLMFALPLCEGTSRILITSPLQSAPYADMTVKTLEAHGIRVEKGIENGLEVFTIPGGQKYTGCDRTVEGDFSQAAFFFVANALGSDIKVSNLDMASVQGDRAIIDIIRSTEGCTKPFEADVSQIPDLVPILAVLASMCQGTSRLYNAARLRIKESDRLVTTAAALNSIGADVRIGDDELVIRHVDRFTGGTVDGANDHRIVMAAAVAALSAEGAVTIKGAQAVNKSYPGFFYDLRSLGAKCKSQ